MTIGNRKTAFVTGAARGIGKAIAEGFLRDGWCVAACGRDAARLDELCGERDAADFLPLVFDIRDEAAVSAAVAKTSARFGRIDALVNNAGIFRPGSLETSTADFNELIDTNVKAAWAVLRAVAPRMKEQRSGHIFNIASIAGVVGFSGVGAYGSTKFALRGMSEAVWRELIDFGIKVTAINPSWVDTEMAAHSPVPKENRIQPDDIYRTIQFLTSLSPGASIAEVTIQCAADIN